MHVMASLVPWKSTVDAVVLWAGRLGFGLTRALGWPPRPGAVEEHCCHRAEKHGVWAGRRILVPWKSTAAIAAAVLRGIC